MASYKRAVPVLQVVDVERSLRWYADVLGFAADTFPAQPPYSFAILRRDEAEVMLQCMDNIEGRKAAPRESDPQFLWSVYLRIGDNAILDVAAEVARKTPLLRGPERMFYGQVEFELLDPDGYRVCVGGGAPAGAQVRAHEE